jgi:hypothetical protein
MKTIDGKAAGVRKATALTKKSAIEAVARSGGIQCHLDDEGWKRRSALEEIARVKTVLEEADG